MAPDYALVEEEEGCLKGKMMSFASDTEFKASIETQIELFSRQLDLMN